MSSKKTGKGGACRHLQPKIIKFLMEKEGGGTVNEIIEDLQNNGHDKVTEDNVKKILDRLECAKLEPSGKYIFIRKSKKAKSLGIPECLAAARSTYEAAMAAYKAYVAMIKAYNDIKCAFGGGPGIPGSAEVAGPSCSGTSGGDRGNKKKTAFLNFVDAKKLEMPNASYDILLGFSSIEWKFMTDEDRLPYKPQEEKRNE